ARAEHEVSTPGSASLRRRYAGPVVPTGTGIASRPQHWLRMPSTALSPRSMPPSACPLSRPFPLPMRLLPLVGVGTAVATALVGVWALGGHYTSRDGVA